MRLRASFLALLLVGTWANAADARPIRGDKTLGLSGTGFSYFRDKPKTCDSNGDNCVDFGETTVKRFGVVAAGGYLLSDLIELGIDLNVGKQKGSSQVTCPQFLYQIS